MKLASTRLGLGLLVIITIFAAPAHADVVPAIVGFAPTSATNGAVVTITGTNFGATPTSNIVHFGAVQAAVLSASPTSLQVTVPPGATVAPITVAVTSLTAYAPQPFLPTFAGHGSGISASTFGPRQDLAGGNNAFRTVIADIDGDGKPDLIVANVFGNSVSIYRNISTNSLLSPASFAAPVDLATTTGTYSPWGLAVADVDGDGKLDIITTDNSDSFVSIFRNLSTPGNISSNTFAPRLDFVTGANPTGVAVRDLDGDGRPELLVGNYNGGTVSIFQNTGAAGGLTTNSFAPRMDLDAGFGCQDVAVADLDDDGRPDVVTANNGNGTLSILRNLSSSGSLAFAPKVNLTVPDGPSQLAIGDLDGDGKPDLAVACYLSQTLSVFRNLGTVGSLDTNSFAPRVDFALGDRGHTPAIADLDGDGKPDLAVVTELDSLLSIFQNVSTLGSFADTSLAGRVDFSTGYNAWGLSIGDLNGDGRPDVVFCNQYDSTISIYQNLVPLASAPAITTQPTNQTAVAGSTVVLSVVATGAVPLSYQWSFNGAAISGATNTTLTLTNIHSTQSGNYQVRISNSGGAVTSSIAILTVVAQDILVYSYSGNEKITTLGREFSYLFSGQLFFLPAGTNGTFVGWGTFNGKKQYWVSPFLDNLWITIPGSGNNIYTFLGWAGDGMDDNGRPHLWAYLHRGQNTLLTIANKRKFSFPSTFVCNDTHVYPDEQTGNMVWRETVSTYSFASTNTQAANNNGQTLIDLIAALTQSLVKQGYQKQ